jgi:DNA polymerase-3 subunit gamma/tau
MEQTLYRKYRPQTFADVTSQEHVKQTIQHQLRSGRVAHAYLFCGPRGVGKTTMARLVAKAVNCLGRDGTKEQMGQKIEGEPCNACSACREITSGSSLDVHEIDAASHTGVDNVREHIIESVRFAPNTLAYKVYIIDEVHMLSSSAFNALLKTLEEPPAHAIFILATTEIHKVPPTIVSRCQRFDFTRIPAKEIVARLKELCKEEGVRVAEEVLFEIARYAEGCERDAESLLGQLLALGEKNIGVEEASLVMPRTHTVAVVTFLELFAKNDAAATIKFLNEQVEQGVEMGPFLDGVVHFLRTVLFVQLGGLESYLEEFDDDTQKRMAALSKHWSAPELTSAIEIFLDAKRNARSDAIPQLATELAVVKLSMVPSWRGASDTRATKHSSVQEIASRGARHDTEQERFPKQEVASMHPQPPSDSKTVLGDVPLVRLEEVQEKWPTIFEKIRACNASLPLLMHDGEVCGVSGDVIELRFAYALHAETVNRAKNKQLVESILGEVLGKPVRVLAVHTPVDGDKGDAAVSAVLQAFGGQAV